MQREDARDRRFGDRGAVVAIEVDRRELGDGAVAVGDGVRFGGGRCVGDLFGAGSDLGGGGFVESFVVALGHEALVLG